MRSLLFVPGDSASKIAKAARSGADVLLLDLEDSVSLSNKPQARQTVCDAITQLRAEVSVSGTPLPRLFVRVNSLDTLLTDADLDAIMPSAPDGIMLPKSVSGADVQQLSVKLSVREVENNLKDGQTKIIAIATETAASLFHLQTYAGASQRLEAMTWGAEDLSADLGAESNRLEDGSYADPYRLARALMLVGASTAQVLAIDTVFTAYRDTDALRRECEAARRDGFGAKLAIHPAQVPVINDVFTPTAAMVAHSQRIVAAFRDDPSAGVVGIEGEMIDRPHLLRAERILQRARSSGIAAE